MVLRPSHTATETAKNSSYRSYTLQLFVTTATIFSTVLSIGNDFHNSFSSKIFAVSCVVCESL